MIKNKIKILMLGAVIFVGCSSINIPNFSKKVPVKINEAISTRVNPETEIYSLGTTTVSKSGAIVAQARANKGAVADLKEKIGKEIEGLYDFYLKDMDKYSKSIVLPVIPDLKKYSTDLAVKKVSQKGAWQDAEKIYSLLVIEKKEVHDISQKVLKDFIDNAAKRLEMIGTAVK